MAQIQNVMKIDFSEPIVNKITAKQNDANSRFLTVHLYNNGTPLDITGHKVRIYMRKPDGKEIFNDGEITSAAYGQCKFELTSQALGAVGVLNCEISLYKDNTQILTTETFHVFVSENLRAAGSVESSNEYGALEVLYADLTSSLELMQYMVDEFGTAGSVASSAGASTFWAMLEALYTVNDNALKNASVSEVMNRIGTNTNDNTTTLFGLLKNSTYGLNAIKTKVVESQNWYAKYGTTTQVASLPAVTSSSGQEVTSGSFVAPETGIYRLDISVSKTFGSSGGGLGGCDLKMQCNVGRTTSQSLVPVARSIISQNGYEATTYTGTKTASVYLEKGCQYNFVSSSINSNSGNVTKINSLTVKYIKTTI